MSLPEEVLLQIFQHLKPNDLLETVEVSRSWSRISRDPQLWQSIILTWKTAPLIVENFNLYISKLIQMCPSLKMFKIDEIISTRIHTENIVRTLLENCYKLKHLVLEVGGGVSLDMLEQIATHWSMSLQSLAIKMSSLESGIPSFGKFRSLTKLHLNIEFKTDHDLLFGKKEQENLYITSILDIEGLEKLILEGVMSGFQTLARGIKEGKLGSLRCLALRMNLEIFLE